MGLVWQAIDFDLVPCWADGGAGVLRLPDLGRSRWLRTNPTEHYTLLQAADRSCNQRLLPLIRGVRAWRRHVRLPLRSFHLESMLVGAFNSPPRTWAEGIQLAFSRLADRARRPFADPTAEGATVDEGLSDADRSRAVNLLQQAAAQATSLAASPDPEQAVAALLGPRPR